MGLAFDHVGAAAIGAKSRTGDVGGQVVLQTDIAFGQAIEVITKTACEGRTLAVHLNADVAAGKEIEQSAPGGCEAQIVLVGGAGLQETEGRDLAGQ